ncbi:MAG: bifunctional RNase H/acid phosphatase [Nocardioidaceae bacterium]
MAPRRVVIEADGGSRGNPGPAAYGALVRDADTGELVAEKGEAIGVATNNVAEYRGLIAGLELVREHAPDAELEVRMDSKLVIEQMAGRWKVKHPDMRPLAIEANRLAPFGVIWTWIPRAENSHADRLVNEALDEATGRRKRSARPAATAATAPVDAAPTNPMVGWNPDLGDPTTLVLLRHGRTELTVDKRFSGSEGTDPALDETGRQQAAAAADWLQRHGGIDVIVSSPLARARETAAVVAKRLGLVVEEDDGLREASFGDWDGHTFAEVRERWPAELQAWLGSTSVSPPGGESFDDVAVRVRRTRDRLVRDNPGRTVLAITHVTPIKLLVRAALDAPMSAIYHMELAPGSISVICWFGDGTPSLRQFSVTP